MFAIRNIVYEIITVYCLLSDYNYSANDFWQFRFHKIAIHAMTPQAAMDKEDSRLGTLQRKKIQKSEITTEVGGRVQVLLEFFFLENHPKIALNQYCYFGVVYKVYYVCIFIVNSC